MGRSLDIHGIQKRLPHRFPFLLIDRVLDFQYGEDPESLVGRRVWARKNVTYNEPYFMGHFPDNKVMPGVLQVECMAQAGAIAFVPDEKDQVEFFIVKILEARFRRPVVPGDSLEIKTEVKKALKSIVTVEGQMFCESQLVSEASVMAKFTKLGPHGNP